MKAVLATAFFICSILFFAGCSKTPPDEAQIKFIIDEMVLAVENGKPADVAKHLHKNFQANRQMDASQVKQMLMMYGMQHADISVTVLSSKTALDPVYSDKAESTLSVVVTGFSGRGLPDDGSVRVVNLEWRKDDDWKLLKAEWEM